MSKQTILLISDMRQVYLAEILTKSGQNVRCLDIRNSETVRGQLEKLKDFLTEAEILILPIPVSKIPEQGILNDILNKKLTNGTKVLGGCFTPEQVELLTRRDIPYLDFMEDKIVTEENAVATAEGVIAELVNKSPYNIEEAKIIVSGYGFCGKAGRGALKGARGEGYGACTPQGSAQGGKTRRILCGGFRIWTGGGNGCGNAGKHRAGAGHYAQHYPGTSEGCLYFRYCVRTGGTDFACAKEYGIRADLSLGLPGRYAPKESAYILDRAIERFVSGKEDV